MNAAIPATRSTPPPPLRLWKSGESDYPVALGFKVLLSLGRNSSRGILTLVSVTRDSRNGVGVDRPLPPLPPAARGELPEEEPPRREAVAGRDGHCRRHRRCRLGWQFNRL